MVSPSDIGPLLGFLSVLMFMACGLCVMSQRASWAVRIGLLGVVLSVAAALYPRLGG